MMSAQQRRFITRRLTAGLCNRKENKNLEFTSAITSSVELEANVFLLSKAKIWTTVIHFFNFAEFTK